MIQTNRLQLRKWKERDVLSLYELKTDKNVSKYFPPTTYSQEKARRDIELYNDHFKRFGYGIYACEQHKTGRFIGYVGLNRVSFEAHFSPAIEMTWGLIYDCWGKGFATEAATKVLSFAWDALNLSEVVAFTSRLNTPSIAVMERLGMTRNKHDDFNHPNVDLKSPLCPHLLYRIKNKRSAHI